MIDNHFRRILDKKASVVVLWLCRHRFSPNYLTLFGFLIALAATYFVAKGSLITAIAIWWSSRIFDSLDGLYARASNQTTAFGSFLDISLDMAAYSFFLIGLAKFSPELSPLWIYVGALYTLCITTALALGAMEKELNRNSRDNRGLRLGAGLAEAGETGLFYSFVCLFPQQIYGLTIIWIIVLCITVIARGMLAYSLGRTSHDA